VHVVLSAWEESVAFGHLVAVFAVCAEHPGHADDAAEGEAYNGRVGFPVGGLGVPTTGRRPDVLGVSSRRQRCTGNQLAGFSYGIFPPPPIVKVVVRVRGVAGCGAALRSLSHGRASTGPELGGNSLAVAIMTCVNTRPANCCCCRLRLF
jgi:hypothetical protein